MISFQQLGSLGRLGNQLFQYAFLRLTAKRLSVPFYCPRWIGDEIFLLNDREESTENPIGIDKTYCESNYSGFNESALQIKDGTEIVGYFQTERYFDGEKVRKWYTFKNERIARVKEKYKHIDFSKSVGMHLRFGDNKREFLSIVRFYIPRLRYYIQSLAKVRYQESILVFSDEIETSRTYLKDLKRNIIYIEGNEPYEDLYLMSQCHDFICSISTLSWWGAWLNAYDDKIIIMPEEGIARPGGPLKNNDIWPKGWTRVKALRGLRDHYVLASIFYFYKNLLPK